jgi:hypothetical protein
MSGKTNHVGVTTIEELDQGTLNPSIKNPDTDMFQLPARHSTKEISIQLIIPSILSSYTIHILI